ncbi:isocitrate lyase/PEP mutase family protein [Chitinophaga japonensis]|uniref:2-methylisocitrate lyase-like PEP mutase family enzyme n=1 Tax=Chitinophaga japonensis TaxID=104662 RepID=A0A562TFK4_CHIJA|nr:isocitrate lyase/phosphoenolpyruvate mutase family protein [Chitinophaga japonensis]TWI92153.1 2-methylisocitrate lyase-like PEP mutase family enzyme [Chitinophaga japonensis]
MAADFNSFKALHAQEAPLLIGNVWDAQSAKVLEKLQFKALGTSSSAVAATLGYADGENMSFSEYLMMIRRIRAVTSLPLSVDLEAGYGEVEGKVVENLKLLHGLGIAGINIEDSLVGDKGREIVDTEKFTKKLAAITGRLQEQQIDIFINVRCDAFLLNLPDARAEAIQRMAAYEGAGAHGIFLPCITDTEDIKAVVGATSLPVNVMCMPDLPDFDTLRSLGVKRISMGNFVHGAMYRHMEALAGKILADGSFSSLF